MNTLINLIKVEQKRIQKLIDLTGNDDKAAPPCRLRVERRGNGLYCYELTYTKDKKGRHAHKRYLGKPDTASVRAHICARLNMERLARLRHDQVLLDRLTRSSQDYSREAILSALPRSYRMACEANPAGDEFGQRYEELKQWASADYPRNTAPFPKAENYAKDGTRTRSKGETIWYDSLLDLGVLFWYDCVITITDRFGNKKTVSPDFLIQCFDGSFIIIEHLGRLHDKGYAIDYGEKCYWYLHEGFILGKSFFVTSDDLNGGTDSRMIEAQAQQVACLFFGY